MPSSRSLEVQLFEKQRIESACHEDSDLEASGWAARERVGGLRFRSGVIHISGELSAAGSVLFATVRLRLRSVLWLTWSWLPISTRSRRFCS